MSDDCRVTGRSDEETRAIAERTKAELGVSRRRPVNIVRCQESGSVPTIYGRKKLNFRAVPDMELGMHDAKTEFADGIVTITAKRSVRDHAEVGDARARMTLAHELAHAVMHHTQTEYRVAGTAGPTALGLAKGYAARPAVSAAASFRMETNPASNAANIAGEQIDGGFRVRLCAGSEQE